MEDWEREKEREEAERIARGEPLPPPPEPFRFPAPGEGTRVRGTRASIEKAIAVPSQTAPKRHRDPPRLSANGSLRRAAKSGKVAAVAHQSNNQARGDFRGSECRGQTIRDRPKEGK